MIWLDEAGVALRPLALELPDTAFGLASVGANTGELFADELRSVRRAVAGRQAEFATGRGLAHRAMMALGHPARAILRASDRAPIWPSGLTGSLSHCRHYAVAAVSRSLPAIGVDIECLHRLSPRTHAAVFTPCERSRVREEPEATAVFSAKEAVFKAIQPLTRTNPGFLDAEIELDLGGGRFRVAYVGSDTATRCMNDLRGAVAVDAGHVLTLAWLTPA